MSNTASTWASQPCLAKDWLTGDKVRYYCVSASAKVAGQPKGSKDSKTPNKSIAMVWAPSAAALANDGFNTACSVRPGAESGTTDRDF